MNILIYLKTIIVGEIKFYFSTFDLFILSHLFKIIIILKYVVTIPAIYFDTFDTFAKL